MAFPFEPTQLRAQLRAYHWAIGKTETDPASNIIKPLQQGLFYEQTNERYLKHLLSSSPPIPYKIPTDSAHYTAAQLGHRKGVSTKSAFKSQRSEKKANKQAKPEKKMRRTHSTTTGTSNDTISEGFVFNELSVTVSMDKTLSNEDSSKPKAKEKIRNPLSKLFNKSDKQKDEDLSEDSSDRISLATVGSVGQLVATSPGTTSGATSVGISDASESGSIAVSRSQDSALEGSSASRLTDANSPESDLYIEDDEDYEETVEDESDLTISSAFTDMKSESLDDTNGSLMYEYTVPESYVLQDPEMPRNRKGGEDKLVSTSFDKSLKPLTLTALLPSSNAGGYSKTSPSKNSDTPNFKKYTSLNFQKMYDVVHSAESENHSNLSSLIQSRFKLSNKNPLNYFSYINTDSLVDGSKKVKIDIFLPPKTTPEIKQMEISSGVSIVDCIGYILMVLSNRRNAEKFDVQSMNPNSWRIELIDEDGELYDSTFGVLDRTRLLSSYNCPNCLALCKVTDEAERARNEVQTPLPLEFKQNLSQYHTKELNTNNNTASMAKSPEKQYDEMKNGTIEVKVGNIPGTSTGTFVSFYISSATKIADLLDLIGEQYHFDPSNFLVARKRLQSNHKVSGILSDDSEKDLWIPLTDNSLDLAHLSSNVFRLVPNVSNKYNTLTKGDLNMGSILESGITPSATYTPAGITPPPVKQLEGKFHEMAIGLNDGDEPPNQDKSNRSNNVVKTQAISKSKPTVPIGDANFNFGDLFHGKGPQQLPATLNTIYFKWKVYRKKSPILNRIEKSLILDGDHIHLAPTDDIKWKRNPYENPFSSSNSNSNSHSHHHHHYLHHYNYSKFYNDTIMKTSSFHITQIVKIKHYKESKNPNHFKIVIEKANETGGKETTIKKKYDLEAQSVAECEEIIEKITWALQVYNLSNFS